MYIRARPFEDAGASKYFAKRSDHTATVSFITILRNKMSKNFKKKLFQYEI